MERLDGGTMFWDKVTSRGPSGWHTSTITIPCDSKVRGKKIGNLTKEEVDTLRKAEKGLSDAYLRVRELVGAWNTNHGGENRFERI